MRFCFRHSGGDVPDGFEAVPDRHRRTERRQGELNELYRHEKHVERVPVPFRTVHRLVPVRTEVLQGQGAEHEFGDELPLRHQNVPNVPSVRLLCVAEAAMPVGRMIVDL